jgi:hypothetical protein
MEIVSFTINSDLKENIDILRGDIPRSRFIVRLLEAHVQSNKKNKRDEKATPVGYRSGNFRQQVEY